MYDEKAIHTYLTMEVFETYLFVEPQRLRSVTEAQSLLRQDREKYMLNVVNLKTINQGLNKD